MVNYYPLIFISDLKSLLVSFVKVEFCRRWDARQKWKMSFLSFFSGFEIETRKIITCNGA